MLEPDDGKLSRPVLRGERERKLPDLLDYSPLVETLHGQVIRISQNSADFVNPMDINVN